LVDQQEDPNDRKHITSSSTADTKRFKESFMRPLKDKLLDYGFSTFVSHDKLEERRYIVDDTILIQVEVCQSQ